MAVAALKPRNAAESLRDIVQDLLVPELKAIKTELDSQRRENETHFAGIRSESAAIRNEVKITSAAQKAETESLRVELRLRDEKQTQALYALSERQTQAFNVLSEKMGTLMEVRERLAVLEDRAKRT